MAGALLKLAEEYGVATQYVDNDGMRREVGSAAVVAALAGFEVRAEKDHQARHALRELHARQDQRAIPVCTVVVEGEPATIQIRLPESAELRIVLEEGDYLPLSVTTEPPPGHSDSPTAEYRRSVALPTNLPCGYHRIEGPGGLAAPLIVVPASLGTPQAMGEDRIWGYAVQLYSVCSGGSWAIGDLTDLGELAQWSASQGAGYLLTNPLHAAEPTTPISPSPYSPTSRRFLNPIYIRPEAIAGYDDLPEGLRGHVAQLRTALLSETADAEHIDRDAVWNAKIAALQAIYDSGRLQQHDRALAAFLRAHTPDLERFATWCALVEVYGQDVARWPEPLRDPESAEVARFGRDHADRVDLHSWLQWVAAEQLAAAQQRAVDAGMAVGIMTDLAVGVGTGSAEVWGESDSYASGVTIGAPPDAYNSFGQGWGLAAWRPDRLAESGYRPFRRLVRSMLRGCGGVRIDHIMGLFRLWWIPAGSGPADGTYVRYDHHAMVGILLLEAQRADALIVGEDLGTVEPWVRDYLAARGVFGTSVLWFERTDNGAPLPPDGYREQCMASITTHDLAPTAGYLEGAHITVRDRLGLLRRPGAEELSDLRIDLARWESVLESDGLLKSSGGEPRDAAESHILALHRYLMTTPSRMICAALTDAVGDKNMQNQPGTVDEYPNWRVPLRDSVGARVYIEDLRTSARARRLAHVLNGE